MFVSIYLTKVALERLALLFREDPGSNLGPDKGLLD
jgi:hypothetical protein